MRSSAGSAKARPVRCLKLQDQFFDLYVQMPIKDAPIVQGMRHYSGKYPRFGARRVRIFFTA